jgi:hypothetical protein
MGFHLGLGGTWWGRREEVRVRVGVWGLGLGLGLGLGSGLGLVLGLLGVIAYKLQVTENRRL